MCFIRYQNFTLCKQQQFRHTNKLLFSMFPSEQPVNVREDSVPDACNKKNHSTCQTSPALAYLGIMLPRVVYFIGRQSLGKATNDIVQNCLLPLPVLFFLANSPYIRSTCKYGIGSILQNLPSPVRILPNPRLMMIHFLGETTSLHARSQMATEPNGRQAPKYNTHFL
jgi:hypothetical protein